MPRSRPWKHRDEELVPPLVGKNMLGSTTVACADSGRRLRPLPGGVICPTAVDRRPHGSRRLSSWEPRMPRDRGPGDGPWKRCRYGEGRGFSWRRCHGGGWVGCRRNRQVPVGAGGPRVAGDLEVRPPPLRGRVWQQGKASRGASGTPSGRLGEG